MGMKYASKNKFFEAGASRGVHITLEWPAGWPFGKKKKEKEKSTHGHVVWVRALIYLFGDISKGFSTVFATVPFLQTLPAQLVVQW